MASEDIQSRLEAQRQLQHRRAIDAELSTLIESCGLSRCEVVVKSDAHYQPFVSKVSAAYMRFLDEDGNARKGREQQSAFDGTNDLRGLLRSAFSELSIESANRDQVFVYSEHTDYGIAIDQADFFAHSATLIGYFLDRTGVDGHSDGVFALPDAANWVFFASKANGLHFRLTAE